MPENWLTISEVCAKLRISRETLRKETKAGRIPCGRLPSGRPRYDTAVIEEQMRERGLTSIDGTLYTNPPF